MKKIILTHGILGGALISAIMAFSILKYNDVINFNENMIYGFSFMLIAFILPFISIWKFRKVDGTSYQFKRAFLLGLGVSFLASLIYVLTWEVVFNIYIPNFMEKYSEFCLKQLTESGATADVIAAKQSEMAHQTVMYVKAWYRMGLTFMEIFPIGLIASSIAALTIRKKNNVPIS